ncbi:hypothetical protein HZS_4645 [Henneguya salminicola]|nr:hypothetical protein HZS_4645 [Henneguya salminicola]
MNYLFCLVLILSIAHMDCVVWEKCKNVDSMGSIKSVKLYNCGDKMCTGRPGLDFQGKITFSPRQIENTVTASMTLNRGGYSNELNHYKTDLGQSLYAKPPLYPGKDYEVRLYGFIPDKAEEVIIKNYTKI